MGGHGQNAADNPTQGKLAFRWNTQSFLIGLGVIVAIKAFMYAIIALNGEPLFQNMWWAPFAGVAMLAGFKKDLGLLGAATAGFVLFQVIGRSAYLLA